MQAMNPTVNFQVGNVAAIPVRTTDKTENLDSLIRELIQSHREDWDSFEGSWDFAGLPLLTEAYEAETLAETYANLRQHWAAMTLEMQRLEEENNRIFIEAYGLQDELTPAVPLNEITLTCNPHYRYANNKTDPERETQLQADTMAELISYAVGCMFGRYSIDKSGLILANQGETLQDYRQQIPDPRFLPDEDNVIPLIDFDGDWFEDDISERFKQFLKVTLGAENYPANLKFIEDSLGKDVRKYFLKDFYPNHVQRYKKRPIYWLFSSPKGTFNALIYLHRYQPDTASIVLNDYLREFRTKLSARKQALEQVGIRADDKANQGEKTKALKAISKIDQALAEINDYERDILYPLATRKMALDLDDGVKVNYPKLGKALKSVVGLS
jgi:type II restriction/modification system DNA methylase subunit YeeA